MKTGLLVALAFTVVTASLPESARAQVPQAISPGSLGGANLLSVADSDFESWSGDWTGIVNATMSQDTAHQYLHDDSAAISIAAAGTATAVLGNGVRIPVNGGDTYRIDGFFKAPAIGGETAQWGLSFFDAAGHNLSGGVGITGGAVHGLDPSGHWQFTTDDITAPAGSAYVQGVWVNLGGTTGSASVDMDDVTLAPRRAATLIGARADGDTVAVFNAADSTIGPLQITKMFYSGALPASFNDTECAGLPATVTCIITYKTLMDASSLQGFVRSIPSNEQRVILVYYQEPEDNSFSYSGLTGGPAFVAEFENQVGLIRAAGDNPNVFVAQNANGYQYDPGTSHANGADCSFIPPATSADLYLLDIYENPASGANLANQGGQKEADWRTWLGCVMPQGKPIGLGEYGLNCGPNDSADGPTTAQAMAADETYLSALPVSGYRTSGLLNAPVFAWDYWYRSDCVFTGPAAIDAWHSTETRNGGGA